MNSDAETQTRVPDSRPTPVAGDSCNTFVYVKKSFKTGAEGTCRRNPPVVVGTDTSGDRWPSSRANDWCGEYTRRATAGQHSNSKAETPWSNRSGAYRRRVTSMAWNILALAAMFLLASSATAQETPSSVSSSVWKIYYTKNEAYSATAVAVGGNRFITNAHFFTAFVGLDTRNIALKQQGEREVIGFRRVLALSMTYDLAIFETKKNVDWYLHLASRFSKDEFLYVLGYPEGSLRRLDLAARVTYEDSLSFLMALDGESLSGETYLGGLSGSPVVNEKRHFVALIHNTNRNLAYGIHGKHIEALMNLVRYGKGSIGVLCSDLSLEKCVNEGLDKTRLMAKHGDKVAQYQMGHPDDYIRDYVQDTRAGRAYIHAQGGEVGFVTLLNQSAEQGFPRAQRELAFLAQEREDWRNAVYWFQLAAESNDPVSLYELSLIHHHGDGVSENSALAFGLALESAHSGYNGALHNVGVFIWRGWGVEEDREVAILWLERARDQGHEPSRVALDKLR